MTAAARAHVASSFTLIKGAMLDETYAAFAAWDATQTKRQNLDRLRETNLIGAGSATWLRDVAKVLNRRFDPDGRDRALVTLARGGLPVDEWKPILLWHITRDEFLLRDFLENWLFSAYEAGAYRANPEELHTYLRSIRERGATTEHAWTDATLKRVAAGLLKMATDFGLLRGRGVKLFGPYHLPDRSFLYLLHAIRDERQNPGKVIAAADWRLFLMRPSDVEQEVVRLHQFRRLEYHVAGSLASLKLPCLSADAYAASIVA